MTVNVMSFMVGNVLHCDSEHLEVRFLLLRARPMLVKGYSGMYSQPLLSSRCPSAIVIFDVMVMKVRRMRMVNGDAAAAGNDLYLECRNLWQTNTRTGSNTVLPARHDSEAGAGQWYHAQSNKHMPFHRRPQMQPSVSTNQS
jgi:hypothetical protein